jgi:hypothetical protein
MDIFGLNCAPMWTTVKQQFLRQLEEVVERLGESLYKHLKQMNVSEKEDAIVILLNSNQLRNAGRI